MRKRRPSSVVWSKTGAAVDFVAVSRASSSKRQGSSGHCRSVAASLMLVVQDEGKSGPASPGRKSLLQKCSRRRCLALASAQISPCSLVRWASLGSGPTKASPSSRRSERYGLNTSFIKAKSCASKHEAAPCSSSDQKRLPLPARLAFRSSACDGVERSNSSRFRSTPFAETRAVRANRATCMRDGRPSSATRAAVTALTGAIGSTGAYISAMDTSSTLTLSAAASSTAPAEMRPLKSAAVFAAKGPRAVLGSLAGRATLMRSRPKATPP
mmetsp:Transcript_3475/g.10639  ORF Transcript_3475/g.10639 Transcript_3475/m.10639 type:complete len:270 (-) Transcript_3475:463-1272(-)